MRKVRTEERELTARLLNHIDDQDGDNEDQDENGTHSDSQSYELKSRSRVRNGINTGIPFHPTIDSNNQHTAKRKVYTDQVSSSHLVDFVEWAVKPGDTLSSLSLKSGCTISHLKRANNLMTDQDFYALSVIRIPVKRYGILSEVLVMDNNGTTGSQETADLLGLNQDKASVVDDDDGRTSGLSISSNGHADGCNDAQKFIQNLDKEVTSIKEVMVKRSGGTRTSLSLANNEIPLPLRHPISGTPVAPGSSFHCDGADGGLTIYHALILALVICILVPVIYVFVAEEHQMEMSNHSLHSH